MGTLIDTDVEVDLDLSKEFKERWKNREFIEESPSISRIKNLFKS